MAKGCKNWLFGSMQLGHLGAIAGQASGGWISIYISQTVDPSLPALDVWLVAGGMLERICCLFVSLSCCSSSCSGIYSWAKEEWRHRVKTVNTFVELSRLELEEDQVTMAVRKVRAA